MTLAAKEFAAGELRRPLTLSGRGEIASLASALEKMRAQLLANIAELSSWNTTLETRVQEQTESLRRQQSITRLLLRRVLTAQEEERARISRELHDEIGQLLTAIELNLDRLAGVNSGLAEDEIARIKSLRTLTDQALINLRRVISAMRPGVLDELGLIPALGWIIDHTLRPLGVKVSLEVVGLEERLPGDVETILFRIAQEAISNTVRHSRAESFTVRMEKCADEIVMTLSDDGLGFDQSRSKDRNGRTLRLGLAGMHERASLVGGKVFVESELGRGTTVIVRIPLEGRAGSEEAVNPRCDYPVPGFPSTTLKEPVSFGEADP
jgi:signal transduction histidine kinase